MPPPGAKQTKPTRRCLFGKPTSNDLDEFEKNMKDTLEEKSKRWGYDFDKDRPLDSEDVNLEPLSLTDVPQFYHPRVHKGRRDVNMDLPSTSANDSQTTRETRAAKRRRQTETENEMPNQKQTSIMNFLTVTKRRSGKVVLCGDAATPKKLSRAHSDNPESSPFRYVSADAEKRTRFDVRSPTVSPKKSPRKGKMISPKSKKSPPRKNIAMGRLRRNISALV